MKQLLCVCGACGPLPREALPWKRGGWPPWGGAGGDAPAARYVRPARLCHLQPAHGPGGEPAPHEQSGAESTGTPGGRLPLTAASCVGAMPGGKGQATEKGKREPLLSVAGQAPGKPLPCPRRPAIPPLSMKTKSSETRGFLCLANPSAFWGQFCSKRIWWQNQTEAPDFAFLLPQVYLHSVQICIRCKQPSIFT